MGDATSAALQPPPPPQQQQQVFTLRQAQDAAARLRSQSEVLKMVPRASKDDPDYVESFYKASRLHFVGESPGGMFVF